ncbi:MAG: hypothetical protein AB1646_11790 [Thermodesulfobacteriota bacterium]
MHVAIEQTAPRRRRIVQPAPAREMFTDRLLSLRRPHDSQSLFLGRIGLRRQQLVNWRRDEDRLGYPGTNVKTVMRIAEDLNVNPQWLLFGTGPQWAEPD